jgi:DNA-binding transcriptional MerR regulator
MLTLHEVSKKTGLSQNFIRICKTKLGDILNPYIFRGNKNRLLFDDSVIVIFDKIRRLKDEGLSISDIVHGFKQEFTTSLLNTNKDKLNLKQTENLYSVNEASSTVDALLKNMIHGRVHALEADKTKLELEKKEIMQKLYDREKRIKDLERVNQEMKTDLKSLPFGRTPEQIRADYASHQQAKKEKMRLLMELKNSGCFSFLKRARIIKDLIEYV